jgi:hypothetical protein
MRAAETRRVAMVDHLAKYGANVNHADKRGKAALMRAALGGDGTTVDHLRAHTGRPQFDGIAQRANFRAWAVGKRAADASGLPQ